MIPARQALARLKDGNARFVSGHREHAVTDAAVRAELAAGQQPFAVVLGCADSRVPAEIVFDQGLGDLFVVRVAGNVAAPTQLGSVEFAVEQLGTRLVVVLGHSGCGAVLAALSELEHPSPDLSPNLRTLIALIRPALAPLLAEGVSGNRDELVRRAVCENVHRATAQLRRDSALLERRVAEGELLIAAAEYSLESGVVTFLAEPAGTA